MGKISIQDIAEFISTKHGLTRQEAETFISMLFDVINEGLDTEKAVKVKGLGTFKVIDVRERESVNVNTGERVVIEGHGKITFTPDPIMRDLVNKPFAQFETVVLNEGVDLVEMGKVQSSDDIADIQESEVADEEKDDTEFDVLPENEEEAAQGIDDDKFNLDDNDEDTLVEENITKEITGEQSSFESDVRQETDDAGFGNVDGVEPVSDEDETNSDISITVGCGVTDDAGKENVPVVTEAATGSEEIDSSDIDPTKKDVSESDTMLDEATDTNPANHRRVWVLPVSVIAAAVLALGAGYFWGRSSVEPVIKYKTVCVVEKRPVAAVSKDTVVTVDTVKVAIKQDTAVNTKASAEVDVAKTIPTVNSQILLNAQAVVNTGAYRIVGTEKTVTVKKGETLAGISRLYFGNGMECYIQVHNGIEDVKPGMKLKIPKLELKRRK